MKHKSADSSHYDNDTLTYDELNDSQTLEINELISNLLKKHSINTVLDMTCGTGSQVLALTKAGFNVTGSDFSAPMLKVAKSKAPHLTWIEGDMRSLQVGQFDAVITIFNAIGHLTKKDFAKALRNIHANLNPGGLYLFDIFDLSYLLTGDNITDLTIDWVKDNVRKIQYSTINTDGVLTSYTTTVTENTHDEQVQTLQTYTKEELTTLCQDNGFTVLEQLAFDSNHPRILTIAKRHSPLPS